MPPKRKKAMKTKVGLKRKPTTRYKKKEIKMENAEFSDDISRYTCSICDENFSSESDFNEHVSVCKIQKICEVSSINSKTNIKCNSCSKVFKYRKNYISHCKNEHSKIEGSVACAECHVRCPNKEILTKHIKDTHKRQDYECPNCEKKFVRHAHVLRHMAQSGCSGEGVPTFPCEICNACFSRKDNLIVHLRFQHILKRGYQCKHCNYYTNNFSKLIKHWQERHIESIKYECDICGKQTSTRTSITKHLEIHGERKHSCEVCGYSTFTAEVLKRHVLTHTKDKPHKCEICGQSYIQRLQLQRHLEKHTGNICSTCGQTFASKVRLLIHERVHLGLKKLVCPFEECSSSAKEFINESNLHTHVKTHFVSKDYQCEVCEKRFHTQVNMRRHVLTHKLDRPRRCMYCVSARAYIRGEQLLRHVRKHHHDLFRQHLRHVRAVLGGTSINVDRVTKSELESILNVLDAESDRILDGYSGSDVLYGGVQDPDTVSAKAVEMPVKQESNPLMSEEELEDNLKKLLSQLVDMDTLECFGWPDETIDTVLEKVIEQCGARAADRSRWTRVQRLRENAKHLFLYAVEDKNIARMLDTYTIDQVIRHILAQVADGDDADGDDAAQ